MVRTTIRLPEGLLDQAKDEARKRGKTLTALIEDSLWNELHRAQKAEPRIKLVIPDHDPGPWLLPPHIDPNKTNEVLEYLEQDLPLEKRR